MSTQAEISVIGAALLSRRALDEILPMLQPADFEDWRDETIWRAISNLANGGLAVDVITVSDELLKMGELERIGGAHILHQRTSEVPTASNAGYYAEIVLADAMRRRLKESAIAIAQIASGEGSIEEQGERARGIIDQATKRGVRDAISIGDGVDEVLAELAEAPRYHPTPWKRLNDLISGWMPGGLYVVGARPGSGKTIMGLQAGERLTKDGAVAFSSLEMSSGDLTKRLFAMRGGIHMTSLSRNSLSPAAWDTVAQLRPEIARMPLFIDDRSHVTVAQIRAHARSVARRHGHLSAVVVDYLQLISGPAGNRPRHEVVGEISRSLKILARELDCPVIALCQLNRNSEGGGRPTLADLRESGTIEQDADVVILLQREKDPDDNPTDELRVIVAKNRQGRTGDFPMVWEGEFARLSTAGWFQ